MTAPATETVAPAPAAAPEPVAPAPAAAPITEAAPPPTAPAPEPTPVAPMSRAEAKRGMHEARAQRETAAAKVDDTAPAAPAEATPAAPAAPAAPGTETKPADAAAPAAAIRVPIPEGHPLRDSGRTYIEVTSAEDERAVRASLNSHTRRAEVERLEAENADLRKKQIEREARDAATNKWVNRPEYQVAVEKYKEIKETVGQAEASAYWRGVNEEFARIETEEIATRTAAVEQADIDRAAEHWKGEAWQNVSTLPESIRNLPGFSQWFEHAYEAFEAELGLNHYPEVKTADDAHKAFVRFFGARINGRPEVIAAYRSGITSEEANRTAAAAKAAEQTRREEQIKRDAVEEYKRTIAAQRTTVAPPHPLGNLNGAGRESTPGTGEAAAPAADLSPSALRRQARQGAREDARRRLGG